MHVVGMMDTPVNGGLLPLPAPHIPPCHAIGTPTDHPSTGKRQSCGPFMSKSSSASQSGLQLKRYKCRVRVVHSRTALLTSHTTLDNLRTACWGLDFREQMVFAFVFQWLLLFCCFCFGLGSVPLSHVWGFQKLVYFSYFLISDTLSFSICHSDILLGISYSFQLNPRECSGIILWQ